MGFLKKIGGGICNLFKDAFMQNDNIKSFVRILKPVDYKQDTARNTQKIVEKQEETNEKLDKIAEVIDKLDRNF